MDSRNGNLFPMRLYCSCCFSTAHSLNSSNTTLFLALCIRNTQRLFVVGWGGGAGPLFVRKPKKKKKRKVRDGGALRADALACARHVNVAPLVLLYVRENEESSSHSWMVGLLSGDHLSGQSEGGEIFGVRGGERSLLRSGTHTGNDGLSTKVRAPCF